MSSKRVLVICPDILPLPGLPTTGAGLRTWGIGNGLQARGHEVIFSLPQLCLTRGYEVPRSFADYAWEMTSMDKIVRKTKPDIVIFSHWPSVLIDKKLDIPTVLDFHGPHTLEREFQGFGDRSTNAWHKVQAIRKADFFTCAGEKQRNYFLGWLMAAGIRLTDRSIAAIPVCLSPDVPAHQWNDGEPIFVYGGVFLPWQDPSVGLQALMHGMESQGRGRLNLYGGNHPIFDIKQNGHFEKLAMEIDRCRRVQRMGFLSHDRLIEDYCQAHVALDVMARNPERELAFTTRTVEYLWCGLPVIYQDFSELSELIRTYQAGWVVNPADVTQVEAAIQETLSNPAEVRRRGENAQQLVRERLVWDSAVEPLDAFCRNPWQIDPLPMSVWAWNPKGISTLMREVAHNMHHGGLTSVAYYSARYIKRQARFLRE